MDQEVLDWGMRNLREKIDKAAEDMVESFKGLNIESDVMVKIIEMRFLDDPPSTSEEINQILKLGRKKAVDRIINTCEGKVLDIETVSGITLFIYKCYGKLYLKHQAIQKQKQKKQKQQSQKTDPL